jgi:hypothetical protein
MAVYQDDGSGALLNQPANQVSLVTAVLTTAATSTTPFGFATAAQADHMVANLNAIRLALIAAGIMKSS